MPDANTDTQNQNNDTSAPEWVNSIQDESLRKDPNIVKYKNVDEFAKGHLNAVKLVGAKGVILPSEKATPEELNEFYGKIGRPAKPEDYKFEKVEVHKSFNPEIFDKNIAALAHKHGLTQKQAEGLRHEMLTESSKVAAMNDQKSLEAKQAGETALRKEWGEQYDANFQKAKMVAEKFGGKDVVEAVGNNPALVKMLATLGKNFSEDTIQNKGITGDTSGGNPQATIDALVKDAKSDYYSSDDIKRGIAIKKVQDAYKALGAK